MCLALLRGCGRLFWRHEDGTDAGGCSIDFYLTCVFFVITGVEGEQGHAGNTEIGVVIHRRIRMWYLSFTYTPASTVSLIFSDGEVESEQMIEVRAAKPTFHIFLQNIIPRFPVNFLSSSSTVLGPQFQHRHRSACS